MGSANDNLYFGRGFFLRNGLISVFKIAVCVAVGRTKRLFDVLLSVPVITGHKSDYKVRSLHEETEQ